MSIEEHKDISPDIEESWPGSSQFTKNIDKGYQSNEILINFVEVNVKNQENIPQPKHQLIVEVDKTDRSICQKEILKTTPPLVKMGLNHISIYEGDEDPKKHWFFCEIFWDANTITNEDKQMAHFAVAL